VKIADLLFIDFPPVMKIGSLVHSLSLWERVRVRAYATTPIHF
jgi:hypothetical protein